MTPLYDGSGMVTRLIGIVHDITERKPSEIALREADTRKTEFLAMLSHELRNPLAPIRYSLEVLDSSGSTPSATRIVQIIGNMLGNAMKFTPSGGRVTVSLARD